MKKNKYTKSRLHEQLRFFGNLSILVLLLIGTVRITVGALENTSSEIVIVEAEPITVEAEINNIKANTSYSISELQLNGGVATILDDSLSESDMEIIKSIESSIIEKELHNEDIVNYLDGFEEPQYIRCTGYCDYGYTKSGEYTREGIVAGRLEWLGKTCYIYEVAEDGSCGELIGVYEFLDTGYGINGSLVDGTSIDVWHPSEDAVWDWMGTYGDYVYIQIVE